MRPPIVLLTDFGNRDPFVGIMKGVIAQIAPQAVCIDLTHAVPPGDIRQAAVILWQAVPYFSPGTIFLCVVDPGVGTSRLPVLVRSGAGHVGKHYTFIGPDNGLFSFVVRQPYSAHQLSNPELALPAPSHTFHGRDIFAPAAAHAWNGAEPEDFGPPASGLQRLPAPRLNLTPQGAVQGEILFADHFGNLLTSLGQFEPSGPGELALKPWVGEPSSRRYAANRLYLRLPDASRLPLVKTFADIPPGQCGILIGSSGLVEIAANNQSAKNLLALEAGETVDLYEDITQDQETNHG